MTERSSRRRLLTQGAAAATALASGTASAAPRHPAGRPFLYSLNTSTIRGQQLSLEAEVDLAAKAGYDAIEPWVGELEKHVAGGKSLDDLRKRIGDRGLVVPSAIGFFEWIVDDPERRAKGLEAARKSMELVRQIGGTRIAAPPVGATNRADIDPLRAAERYRAILELGEQVGVTPQVEVWGFSQTLHRLGAAAHVAIESAHPKACVLADVYHLHRGGSGFTGLRALSGAALHVFHVNDYPADPPAPMLTDAHRVYPGDGVAPLDRVFRDLHELGFRGVLSLELFNPGYWKQDPLVVARTGLAKTKAAVQRALRS